MSEQQLSKLAAALVEHQRNFGAMPTEDRQWVIQHAKEAIALFTDAVKNRTGNGAQKLLEFVATVKVDSVLLFLAAEKFRKGETIDGIKVRHVGDTFEKYYLSAVSRENTSSDELVVNRLLPASSNDLSIIVALGGVKMVEITLGQFREFLKTTDEKLCYVAYIRGVDSVLRAVHGLRHDDGWDFDAQSLGGETGWNNKCRFLSR